MGIRFSSSLWVFSQGHDYDRISGEELPEAIEMESKSRRRRVPTNMDVLLREVPEEDLETYGFYAFLLFFIIFNLIYWPWLLISADYFNWHVDLSYNVKDE